MTTKQPPKQNNQQQSAKVKAKPKTVSKKPTVKSSLVKYNLTRVDVDKEKVVLNLLEDALKVTFPSQAKINWKEIHKEKLPKKLKKEKIRKLKSELKDKEITEKNIELTNQRFFCLGFNKVVKSLQNNEVICLLVSHAFPDELKDILTHLSVTMDVPILGLNALESSVKSTLGFNCSVIGFTKEIQKSSDFEQLTEKVLEASSILKGEKMKEDKNVNGSASGNDSHVKAIEPIQQNPLKNLHLKRKSSNHSRAFKPYVCNFDDKVAHRKKFKSCDIATSTSYSSTVM